LIFGREDAAFQEQFRLAGIYVDRILRGTPVGDLSIQFPTRFTLSINLTTARALDIDVPLEPVADRRRADRITAPFAAVHESACGTKQTCRHAATMSAVGAKPDDESLRAVFGSIHRTWLSPFGH
jgi:hypothetical protein